MPKPLFRPPKHLVQEWPEVFDDLYMNTMPVAYLDFITLEFNDGRVWEINIKEQSKESDNDTIADHLLETFQEYKHDIKKIHFNGGEPMLNKDQVSLLDRLDLSNVFISYNTNGTVYPDQKIIDLWKQAKLVKLFFSIDATEQAFEYIRYPAKWAEVADNMIRMRDELPSNVMFGINATVG
jgi:organic radical activating enzyme